MEQRHRRGLVARARTTMDQNHQQRLWDACGQAQLNRRMRWIEGTQRPLHRVDTRGDLDQLGACIGVSAPSLVRATAEHRPDRQGQDTAP